MPVTTFLLCLALRPTTIVFVRHGETQANATGKYNSRTIDTFSELGEKQVRELTPKLEKMRFDAIVVSPSPRALKTVAPYLRATHQTATIWPELYECCDAHSKTRPSLLAGGIRFGSPVKVPAELNGLLRLQKGRDHMIMTNSYDDGIKQVQYCAENLKREFNGKTVLVIGHSLHGGRMLEFLQGKPMLGRIRPANCSITPLTIRS